MEVLEHCVLYTECADDTRNPLDTLLRHLEVFSFFSQLKRNLQK